MTKYYYKAHVTSVYDGDTITVDIDLGFGIVFRKQKIRLYGIDTPEVRGPEKEEGKKVRDLVRSLILDKDIEIQTFRDSKGKYGRWLGTIHFEPTDEQKTLIAQLAASKEGYTNVEVFDTVCLNTLLLDLGMAELTDY